MLRLSPMCVPLQTLKTDGAAWASKYARGGSARKLSARKFYIVVDALQGHLTTNGIPPFLMSFLILDKFK